MLSLKNWAVIPVTLAILSACTLPKQSLNTSWAPPQTASSSTGTLTHGQPLGEFKGDLKLEINPALLGEKYKHSKPYSLTPESTSFQILSHKQKVYPKIECVQTLPDKSYIAYFGYENSSSEVIEIPVGPRNKVLLPRGPKEHESEQHDSKSKDDEHKDNKSKDSKPERRNGFDQGQPSRFQPGRVEGFPQVIFSIPFSKGQVSWILNGKSAVASKRSKTCPVIPTPTPEPSATPTPEPTPTPTAEPTPTPVPTPSDVAFDPADPSSLGDLFPDVPGNKNLPQPETSESFILLNDHLPEPVAAGHVALQLADPVAQNLQSLLQEYNAIQVTEPINGMYFIQPDMTRVDVSTLADNLRTLNGMASSPDQVVTYGAFGNLEAAKTLAFATAMALDPRVKSVGFDPVLELASGVTTQEQTDATYVAGGNVPLVPSAQNSWWLNERSTWITHAWEYSLGYNLSLNRPINIGVIDGGFSGMKYHSEKGRDFENQILWYEGGYIKEGKITPWDDAAIQAEENLNTPIKPTGGHNRTSSHGTAAASTIAARFNNGVGIAGVAPYSKIIPIKVGLNPTATREFDAPYSHVLAGIQYLASKTYPPVDIVNISITRGSADSYIYDYFDKVINQESWLKPSQNLIRTLSQAPQRMVFINAAGNTNYDAKLALPSSILFPEMITVGALMDDPTMATVPIESEAINLRRTHVFASDSDYNKSIKIGSNYGNNVTVWAPGFRMLGLSPLYIHSKDVSQPVLTDLQDWDLTSAATPVVAGIAALMKAIDINLTGADIKQRLLDTARTHTYQDDYLRVNPLFAVQLPSSIDSGCKVLNYNLSCGNRYSDTLTIKAINGLNAVRSLTANTAQTFHGVLVPYDGMNGYGFRLENTSQNIAYNLFASDSGDLSGYQAEYTNSAGELAYIPLGQLREQFYPSAPEADVTGWVVPDTDRIQILKIRWLPNENTVPSPTPTPAPTPTPDLSTISQIPARWWVRAFNVNDRVNVLVNDEHYPIFGLGFNGAQVQEITHLLNPYPQKNKVRFQTFNDTNATEGTAWGFELICLCPGRNGPTLDAGNLTPQIIYHDVHGIAENPDRHPARRGNPTLGLVYDQAIYFYKNGIFPSNTTYSLSTLNVSDQMEIELNRPNIGSQLILEHDYTEDYTKNMDLTPLLKTNAERNSFRTIVNHGSKCRPYTSMPNYTYGVEIYNMTIDGQELVFRHRDGEKENLDLYPAGAHFNKEAYLPDYARGVIDAAIACTPGAAEDDSITGENGDPLYSYNLLSYPFYSTTRLYNTNEMNIHFNAFPVPFDLEKEQFFMYLWP
ncbi:hypothetical protein COW36_20690 [bacterium (Candidatus Blackallbacteria) CG17_big_fil_post_rev_8_21_14_2_50_48_46]|uniref:Peptidase S8/S53 domain-containing protein n=1 Tax=bacterium (Candidatus Blackallbacteria) CG17_big_fil_post_rev_8_21_14_2_50_48_46 TaxID=2014261 RepID=A0A2M7FYK4_9BACT|nr:MAG: hypothetical protein COW64_14000 [bacterium (Candidatus Blackallbacteria) CG18_big_fil_WC_8_21_14_2_50_49_26]PIW14460.1 MAG: hypothetical protein COW36_20690 [bacterium (Candidatus Blackallbacteria) CG17_big_fil_post_rev_8_21_14_2_50_48_46]PIW47146.1 MAG: hypothetical protein COW20_13135 [bacterium (Candidatus Blackallbacteria) CG13_big_fil_rev_8_21_14_2_50_49_14]